MCQGQLCSYIRKELSIRNLGLSGIHPHRFTYLQWRVPIGVVLAYRVIVALYTICWLLYSSEFPDILINGAHIKQYAFLTMWTYLVLTVYFLLHCIVCVIHICERRPQMCIALTAEQHNSLFEELTVYPSLWHEEGYQPIPGSDMEEQPEGRSSYGQRLVSRWKKMVWMLYNIASTASIMVTIVFWALLYPGMSLSGIDLIVNFQLHAVTSILVFIETVLTAVPVRLLHVIYPVIYGLIYVAFSGIYYAYDHRRILYPDVLDWSKPGRTVVVILVTGFIILPLIQIFLFGIYKLRMYIYNKCCYEAV